MKGGVEAGAGVESHALTPNSSAAIARNTLSIYSR